MESVLNVLTIFCSSEDVFFLEAYEVGEDLHIITWVRNPSTVGNAVPVGISDDILQEALLDEASQETIQEYLGEGFEYGVKPYQGATPAPPEAEAQGLEAWEISLIVVGSFLLLVLVAILFECRYVTTTDGVRKC